MMEKIKAIHTKTQEQFITALELLDQLNYIWSDGKKPLKSIENWNKFKEQTCISVYNDYTIRYCNLEYFKNRKGFKIISYEKFIETMDVLPKQWCVKMDNQEVVDYCNKYGKIPPYCKSNELYAHFPAVNDTITSSLKIESDYTLISFEKFKRLVLNKEEFIVPGRFCVKTTNIEIISWFNIKLDRAITYTTNKPVYFHYPEFNGCCSAGRVHTELGYKEISEDEFINHILKPKTMKEDKEIIGYKLKDKKYFKPASQIAFGNDSGLKEWKEGKITKISVFPRLINKLKEEGILDLWFEPIYEPMPIIKNFGDTEFKIIPGNNVARTVHGPVSKAELGAALNYLENPPHLSGHPLNLHRAEDANIYDIMDLAHGYVPKIKIGFGCEAGTINELREIYNAFD